MNDALDELQASARQVVAGAGLPAGEDSVWQHIGELGWLLVTVPQALDGLELGEQGACMLHRELGRGLAQAPFLPALMALDAVCQGEVAEQANWVGRITGGECVTAPLAEPELEFEAQGDSTVTLTGLATAVQSADRASHALVWTGNAACVAMVPLQLSGVERIERPTWDSTRRLFDLRFTQVTLDERLVLARGQHARELVTRLQTLRDFALAADSLGAGAAALELTVEHLQTRQQFGRPLALFQALKHRCADLKTQLAAAEALLDDSLLRVGGHISDAEAQSMGGKVKYLACSVFMNIAEESLQLLGGIGMAAEHPCHLFLKRAMLNEHLGARACGYEREIANHFLHSLQ